MPTRRPALLLVVVLLGALGLAACGSSDDGASSSSPSSTAKPAAPKSVNVTMAEYAFSVSGKLPVGGEIHLKNAGDQLHMMAMGKLKAGVTLDKLKTALSNADPKSEEDPTKGLIEEKEIGWPGGFVTPGNEVTFSSGGLTPGSYGIICFLPAEGGGPPHVARGMINQLDVVAGASSAPKADTTYTVVPGKPLDGPATLSAGTHTIKLAGNDIGKQEPFLLKPSKPDQTLDQINEAINNDFSGLEGDSPAPGTGKRLGEYIVFAGFDLDSASNVSFTYDFDPGTYYLAVPDTDGPESGKVPTEIIKITVS